MFPQPEYNHAVLHIIIMVHECFSATDVWNICPLQIWSYNYNYNVLFLGRKS